MPKTATMQGGSPGVMGHVPVYDAYGFLVDSGAGSPTSYIADEIPSGSLDGVNVVFTLSYAPNPPNSLQLYLNGVLQKPGLDFTLSANVITYAVAPLVTDWHLAYYFTTSAPAVFGTGPPGATGAGFPTSRMINATAPLTGGGTLTSDLTIAIDNFSGDSGSGGASGAVPAPAPGDAAAGKFLSAGGMFAAPVSDFTGDSGSGGTSGAVPAPAAGDTAAGKFLSADGTFAVPTGSGVPTLRAINTTLPLTGGGTLASNLTLAVNDFTGDSGSGGLKGTVPAPASGDAAAGKFLSASGTFSVPAGTGVPTSRTISTTAPLTGGGALSGNLTLAVSTFTGDSGSGGARGIVPAPGAGDAAAGKFLSAAGTFAVPSGTASQVTVNGQTLSTDYTFTFNNSVQFNSVQVWP